MNNHPKLVVLFVACAILFSQVAIAQDKPESQVIIGRVVDATGKPVENATVHTMWGANGSRSTRANGQPYDNPLTKEQVQEFWANVGKMEVLAKEPTLTQKDGSFSLPISWRNRMLFAIDSQRNQGCVVELPGDEDKHRVIVLQLTDLVTVTGKLESSDKAKPAKWTHVYVEAMPHPKKPLAINRLISCGSFDGRFEFRLPPGEFRLDAYGASSLEADVIDLAVDPSPTFKIPADVNSLDIGSFELTQAASTSQELGKQSKAEGRWKDFKEHYGEPAPSWHSVDGRNIDHAKNIQGLQGKWVLLDFWGLDCAPCLKREIPKLMDFLEKNEEHRSRFEIVGVFVDYEGKIDSMKKLDAELSSIEINVWHGKKIPFAIVIDNSFTTWERYGIEGLGTMVLIDPSGNIVKGDEKTLQEILDKDK